MCENLEPIGPNLKKLSPKNRASRGLKSIVVHSTSPPSYPELRHVSCCGAPEPKSSSLLSSSSSSASSCFGRSDSLHPGHVISQPQTTSALVTSCDCRTVTCLSAVTSDLTSDVTSDLTSPRQHHRGTPTTCGPGSWRRSLNGEDRIAPLCRAERTAQCRTTAVSGHSRKQRCIGLGLGQWAVPNYRSKWAQSGTAGNRTGTRTVGSAELPQ